MRGVAGTALIAAVMFAASACESVGVGQSELPEDPIAFIYYGEALARERAEMLSDRDGVAPVQGRVGENRSVLNINQFRDYLDENFGGSFADEYAGRIALIDPRTAEVQIVESARRGSVPMAWSKDHRRLLYAQEVGGYMQLFELDLARQVVLRMTRGPDIHLMGCYGPGGRLVVMVARLEPIEEGSEERDWVTRIALMAPGGALQPISPGPSDTEPTCAPDGSAVAYVRTSRGDRDEIWVRSPVEDGAERPITPGRDPSFSPDSRWIVYTHPVGNDSAVWRIGKDGAGRTRLGIGAGTRELRPSVSPDGALVVYESVVDHRRRLFLRRFDGTGDRIFFSRGDGTHTVW